MEEKMSATPTLLQAAIPVVFLIILLAGSVAYFGGDSSYGPNQIVLILSAMVGAIILTFRTREGVKKQDPASQVARRREEGVELVDVKSGQGLS